MDKLNINVITTASPDMMPDIKKIWISCFGGSIRYTDYVFAHLIKPERCLCAMRDGQSTAIMFYEPFDMLCPESGWSGRGAYIYGVATDPAMQGNGLGTALMDFAHGYLPTLGYSHSVLVPASKSLFGFYESRGYESFSGIKKLTLKGGEIQDIQYQGTPVSLEADSLKSLSPERDKYFGQRDFYVKWPESYLAYIDGECASFSAEILRAEGGGYAVCGIHGGKCTVKEIACRENDFGGFLHAIHKRYNADEYEISVPSYFLTGMEETYLPYSMIKWYYNINACPPASSGRYENAYIQFVLD